MALALPHQKQVLAPRLPLRPLSILTLLFLALFFAFPLVQPRAEAPTVELSPTEEAMLARVNEVRASYGLEPLELDPRLTMAARVHVADMQANNNRSHTGRDGSTYKLRIERTGYLAAESNEAIGWGYKLDRMVTWWLNSPVHRRILLSPSLKQVGVGYAGDPSREWGHWWVLDFGTHK